MKVAQGKVKAASRYNIFMTLETILLIAIGLGAIWYVADSLDQWTNRTIDFFSQFNPRDRLWWGWSN